MLSAFLGYISTINTLNRNHWRLQELWCKGPAQQGGLCVTAKTIHGWIFIYHSHDSHQSLSMRSWVDYIFIIWHQVWSLRWCFRRKCCEPSPHYYEPNLHQTKCKSITESRVFVRCLFSQHVHLNVAPITQMSVSCSGSMSCVNWPPCRRRRDITTVASPSVSRTTQTWISDGDIFNAPRWNQR